jgi:prepilin-type N-terminal cleavage/methylation domain-containing protein
MLPEQKQNRSRAAFTLVELLAVIVIIGILSSIMLVALASAAETAKEARTRSQIQRIHELLMTRWESYRTRRVEPANSAIDDTVKKRLRNRVDKIRDLMRMELPDRRTDLTSTRANLTSTLTTEPALYFRYQRMLIKHTEATGADFDAKWTNAISKWSGSNEGAECLYLILSSIQEGDSNGLEFLRENEIGDRDGDGVPEVLDGWGRPLLFMRWANGYVRRDPGTGPVGVISQLHDLYAPDPFDPMGVQGGLVKSGETYNHFALYPVILSAGSDQSSNIITDHSNARYASTIPPNDPYISGPHPDIGDPVLQPLTVRVGDIRDDREDTHLDNISNHQLVVGGG